MPDCAFDHSATSTAYRYAAAAIALSLFGATLAFFAQPQPPSELLVGTIRRDSTWHSPHQSNHLFVLDVEWPFHGPVVVDYEGAWPSTACDGYEVAVDGHFWSLGRVEAHRVDGVNMGRYDACWRWRCLGWSPCRRDVMFE